MIRFDNKINEIRISKIIGKKAKCRIADLFTRINAILSTSFDKEAFWGCSAKIILAFENKNIVLKNENNIITKIETINNPNEAIQDKQQKNSKTGCGSVSYDKTHK